MRDRAGNYIPGDIVETEFPASVQPLQVEDVDVVEGARLIDRRKIYIPEPNALAAAFRNSRADHVLIGTQDFVVEESRSWPTFTRATLLDAT